jgi:serine 3-dehydrogenase (NADP+)
MPTSLKDQIVIIVGASSGIGRATALLMARENARVVAAARRGDRLRGLQEELAKEGLRIDVASVDVAKAADLDQLAERVLQQYGKIDVLVYTAGTNTPERSMKRLNPGIWDMMIGVNLNGAYYATRAMLPHMREAGSGHLIYVSSVSGQTPDVSGASYQASKRGLIGLAHAVRLEEKENGIRTCVVCPGLVNTELLEKRPVKPTAEQLATALIPEDVAEVILAVAKLNPRVVVPELSIMPQVQ